MYSQGDLIKTKDTGAQWQRYGSSLVSGSYPTIANTLTEPTNGASAVVLTTGKGEDLAFTFIGTGDENATFGFKVVGWSNVKGGTGSEVWKPTTLFTGTATLSASVGVADGNQTASERDVDTIVASTPTLPTSLYIAYSPTGDSPAMLILPSLNFIKVAVYFNMATATGATVMWKWMGI